MADKGSLLIFKSCLNTVLLSALFMGSGSGALHAQARQDRATATFAGAKYVVQPGDILKVRIWGYPDPGDGRVDVVSGYVGTTRLFEAHGFTRAVQTTGVSRGSPRWVMRREL